MQACAVLSRACAAVAWVVVATGGIGVMAGSRAWGQSVGGAFTIAVLPDTQYYCRDNTANPGGSGDFFAAQTRWIVDNAAGQNIKFVTHLGDVVNTAGTTTASAQWNVAVNAMNTLRTSTVPHGILPGNHDWTSTAGTGSLVHYRSRFGNTSNFFAGKSWFLGFDPRGVNSAQRFSTPAGDFLHLSLEFDPGNPAMSADAAPGTPANSMAWAQQVIAAHWGIPTIISTHNNLNTSAVRSADSVRMIDALVRRNDQVFMVLNGHYSSATVAETRVTSVNDFGRPVYEMLTDYQSRNRGGDGWMRLLRFDPAAKSVTARTYTPITSAIDGSPAGPEFGNVGRVEIDADSQFTLPLDFAQRFASRPRFDTDARTFERGVGGYTGAADTYVRSDLPTSSFGGSTVLGVDADEDGDPANGNQTRSTLVRFDGLFGTQPGQVSSDRDIVSARLVIDLNTALTINAEGSGLKAHRMLVPWNEATATWNDLGSAGDGIVTTGSTNPDAVSRPDSVRGDNLSSAAVAAGATGAGLLEIDVTASLRAFQNGAPNHGWALLPFLTGGTNGVFFASSENTVAGVARPRLVIDVTRNRVETTTFRQGLGGYSGTVDTTIDQARPTLAFSSATTLAVDATPSGAAGEDEQALLRFEGLVGSNPGQIPTTAMVTSAILKLHVPADVANSQGTGVEIYRLARAWDAASTWDSLSAGITIGVETAGHPDDFAGLTDSGAVGVGFGVIYLDVTDSVRAWVAGAPNHGWLLSAPELGTNAVIFDSSERAGGLPPELVVRWFPGAGAGWVPEPGSAAVLLAAWPLLTTRRRTR